MLVYKAISIPQLRGSVLLSTSVLFWIDALPMSRWLPFHVIYLFFNRLQLFESAIRMKPPLTFACFSS